jgi:hypothetical protein
MANDELGRNISDHLPVFAVFNSTPDRSPTGSLDSVSPQSITGWACDLDKPAAQIDVKLGTELNGYLQVTANQTSEEAVNTLCGGGTAHRFSFDTTTLAPGTYAINAKGVNINSAGSVTNRSPILLPGSPKTLDIPGGSVCNDTNWTHSDGTCQSNSTLTRTWTKIGTCTGGTTHPPTETLSCTFTPTFCDEGTIFHCFNITSGTSDPRITWAGCYAPLNNNEKINGTYYKGITLLGTTIIADNFGKFDFHCDNGVSQEEIPYSKLVIDTGELTNSAKADKTALESGAYYCLLNSDNCITGRSDEQIGYGNMNLISVPTTINDINFIGPHTYSVQVAYHPVANTLGTDWRTRLDGNFFLSGYPSLMVFGPSDENFGFNEQFGTQNKELFFTLYNKFPTDINIISYSINCSNGVTCTADPRYAGFKVSPENSMIIDANFTLNKNNIPSSFSVMLDVNFNIPAFSGSANPNNCFKTYSTYSKPAIFNIGLTDQQDFQTEMKASQDQNFCIGEDGMIGQTGESYAPRVNIGFGGIDSNNNLISIDECDPKTPTDTVYADNNDWVYCSQKEFLVELGEKIGKIGKIREQIASARADGNITKEQELITQENKYSNFQTYIKTQNFEKTNITNSLNKIRPLLSLTDLIGLNPYFGNGTNNNDNNTQLTMLQNMYNKTTFTNNGTRAAGLYTVQIDVNELATPTSSNYLFNTNNEINSNINIYVTMNRQTTNNFDWMFYQQGDTELTENSIYKPTLLPGSFNTSNDVKRGVVLELIYSKTGNNDSNTLYNTFAVPFFIRIADTNGKTDRNFTIENKGQTTPTLFSYWTGFASSLGSGCRTIANIPDPAPLEYRTPDTKKGENTSTWTFEFPDLNSTKKDSVEYLETAIYLPRADDDGIEFSSPFNAYTKNLTCNGNPNNRCTFDINSSLASYLISKTNSLTSIITGIKNRDLCVHKGTNDTGNTQWTIFWNQQKILLELGSKKATITDANICPMTEQNGG